MRHHIRDRRDIVKRGIREIGRMRKIPCTFAGFEDGERGHEPRNGNRRALEAENNSGQQHARKLESQSYIHRELNTNRLNEL